MSKDKVSPSYDPRFAELWNEAREDIDDSADNDTTEMRRLLGHTLRDMFFTGPNFVLECLAAGIDTDIVRAEINRLRDQGSVWYNRRERARIDKSGVPTLWPSEPD